MRFSIVCKFHYLRNQLIADMLPLAGHSISVGVRCLFLITTRARVARCASHFATVTRLRNSEASRVRKPVFLHARHGAAFFHCASGKETSTKTKETRSEPYRVSTKILHVYLQNIILLIFHLHFCVNSCN